MYDLLTAVGLVLVIEGTLYALFPDYAQRAMRRVLEQLPQVLRIGGLVAVGVGFVFVWLVRSF